MNPGDVVLFYRSQDQRAVTSIGIVESYETFNDPEVIARRVKRRTVYSMKDIKEMANRPTRVMLFRLIGHMNNSLPQAWLEGHGVLNGPPQSITKITNEAFELVLTHGR
jgi:hypothetical protein